MCVLRDSERGGASGVPLQISAKLLVMKERMAATPPVLPLKSDQTRGIKSPPEKEPPEGQDPHTEVSSDKEDWD